MILSQNDFASKSNPARFFNCEQIIINDVADVKALVTGTEMKSTIKPTNAYTDREKERYKIKMVVYVIGMLLFRFGLKENA